MADVILKSMTFPNLPDRYVIPSTTIEDGSITEEKLSAELQASIANKADKDGYYQQMTVGNAEQLVSTVGIEDSVPYLLRTTGGSADIGDRLKLSEITGGSVAWNQLLQPITGDPVTINGVTVTKNGDGSVTLNGTATSSGALVSCPAAGQISGHKYYIAIKGAIISNGYTIIGGSASFKETIRAATTTSSSGSICAIRSDNGTVYNNNVMWPQLFDLTLMFGTTIADYLYSLETANAGAGIAQLKAWGFCTEPYYAYDAGSILSVKTTAHREVGFNQWDGEYEAGYYDIADGSAGASTTWARSKNPIPCVPNTSYCFSQQSAGTGSLGYILYYDASGNYLNAYQQQISTAYGGTGQVFTTPANAYIMKFYTNANQITHDICINLSWDGERDGEYEPYEEHTYPLDDVELRGIPKLDANNNLYYDGDTYEADGTVTRRYGVVDLGSLTWTKDTDGIFYSNMTSYGAKYRGSCLCTKYTWMNASSWSQVVDGKFAVVNSSTLPIIFVKDLSKDSLSASEFKTAMSGVYLVYELAEPTTESADPYQETQICNDFGIEEFVDTRTVPMPVGYTALYQPNLRAKLEMSPDSPSDGDGDYIVRQTNGENSYVKLIIPTELPANPSTDGSYHLKLTVNGTTNTLVWEADS